MKNTLFYSEHCNHSIELIQRISKSKLADSLCFMSVDGTSEETRSKVREILYIMDIDVVPTIVINGRVHAGPEAFSYFQKYIQGTKAPQGRSQPPPPPAHEAPLNMGRNISMRSQAGPEMAQVDDMPLFERQDTGGSAFANFSTAVSTPQQEGAEFLKAIDTKENTKGDDLEKRLKELAETRAKMDKETRPPV